MKLLGVWPKPAPGANLSSDPIAEAMSRPITQEDLARFKAEREAERAARRERLAAMARARVQNKDAPPL